MDGFGHPRWRLLANSEGQPYEPFLRVCTYIAAVPMVPRFSVRRGTANIARIFCASPSRSVWSTPYIVTSFNGTDVPRKASDC